MCVRIWKISSGSMNDGPLGFLVFPHQDVAFYNHLEVDPFPSYFIFFSVSGLFLRADKEFGRFREEVEYFKKKNVRFTCVVFQVQDDGTYPLGMTLPRPSHCILQQIQMLLGWASIAKGLALQRLQTKVNIFIILLFFSLSPLPAQITTSSPWSDLPLQKGWG